jgi:crotonobetainyl-CoA:carnitine CoA-transferase CaiB-like acyl-CoA transferase
MTETDRDAGGPLAGLRVLDCGSMIAGPYGATLLGDLGADVVKVEPVYGDDLRRLGAERDGETGSYTGINRNKRGIALDLSSAGGREALGRLVATADALITNMREPAASKLALDYDSVRAHRPVIVWAGVSTFGADGP